MVEVNKGNESRHYIVRSRWGRKESFRAWDKTATEVQGQIRHWNAWEEQQAPIKAKIARIKTNRAYGHET